MYIRTKDGVYDTSKGLYTPSIKMYAIGIKTIYEDDIIKQSDTIEELCDEFVLIEPRGDGGEKYSLRDKKSFIEDYIGYEHIDIVLSYYTIYGAIWVKGKGLIYVAKMNENGVLELI